MKYIKEYNKIDFDDFDDFNDFEVEEYPPSGYYKFNVGDRLEPISNDGIEYYDSNIKAFRKFFLGERKFLVTTIKHSKDITNDERTKNFRIEDYDGYLFIAAGLWPWIKLDGMRLTND